MHNEIRIRRDNLHFEQCPVKKDSITKKFKEYKISLFWDRDRKGWRAPDFELRPIKGHMHGVNFERVSFRGLQRDVVYLC
jgi:hypothetical protein